MSWNIVSIDSPKFPSFPSSSRYVFRDEFKTAVLPVSSYAIIYCVLCRSSSASHELTKVVAMDFEVYLSQSKKFILCRPFVPITEELTRRMAAEVEKLSTETGVSDRLIDVRNIINVMSVSTNYDIAYEGLEDMRIDRSTKVASLQSPGETSHDFVCNAIRNSGFNLRVFTDEAAAIAWLEE
jgi:hypothetical protein